MPLLIYREFRSTFVIHRRQTSCPQGGSASCSLCRYAVSMIGWEVCKIPYFFTAPSAIFIAGEYHSSRIHLDPHLASQLLGRALLVGYSTLSWFSALDLCMYPIPTT